MSCCSSSSSSNTDSNTCLPAPKLTRKVSLIGDSGAGKTSLLHRYLSNDFIGTQATVGAAFAQKKLTYNFNDARGYREVQCNFWDTAGQEKFNCLVPIYLRGSDICLLAFSLTDNITFEHIPKWLRIIQDECSDATVILVGCKSDLLDPERPIIIDKPYVTAKYPTYEYMETSAFNGNGIKELFDTISYIILDKHESNTY